MIQGEKIDLSKFLKTAGLVIIIFVFTVLTISGRPQNTSKHGEEINGEVKEPSSENISNSVSDDIERENVSKASILELLKVALQPVGSTMYVWGGGWNEEDTGAGVEARTIGLSAQWAEFASQQDSAYDYNKTRYQIHDGLDCSGYIGWVIYNTLENENNRDGYVMASTKMAKAFADMGFGDYTPASEVKNWQAGDIMSMDGHAWIVVGECDDKSVVLLHSSPPGVMLCGTKLADGTRSQAIALAEKYMSEIYPEWYAKYPECSCEYFYITDSSKLHWNRETLSDNEKICSLTAEDVLLSLFR